MTTGQPVQRKDLLSAHLGAGKTIVSVEIKEVTLGPRVPAPLHLHPCDVVGVITAGAIAYQIEGAPVQHLGPGDAFHEPADVRVARFDNEGDVPARFVAFYLLRSEAQDLITIL